MLTPAGPATLCEVTGSDAGVGLKAYLHCDVARGKTVVRYSIQGSPSFSEETEMPYDRRALRDQWVYEMLQVTCHWMLSHGPARCVDEEGSQAAVVLIMASDVSWKLVSLSWNSESEFHARVPRQSSTSTQGTWLPRVA